MTTMTIDDKNKRTDRFLRIMDQVTPIIWEIRAVEINEAVQGGLQPIEMNFYKQVRQLLEAAQAIVETKIGVSIVKRCELECCPTSGASDDTR
jgi:hypothetical protein